jgi:hypothetical protein
VPLNEVVPVKDPIFKVPVVSPVAKFKVPVVSPVPKFIVPLVKLFIKVDIILFDYKPSINKLFK